MGCCARRVNLKVNEYIPRYIVCALRPRVNWHSPPHEVGYCALPYPIRGYSAPHRLITPHLYIHG